MKTIRIITRQHLEYKSVCDFANSIYRERIHACARTPPETLIAAIEDGTVYGCIGLSHSVSSNLFLSDQRFQRIIQAYPTEISVGEQNIFAVSNFQAGIPILISTVSMYAQSLGLQKIAFAGIPVSFRTATSLGFKVTVIGKTESTVFSKQELELYRHWLDYYHPLSCILDTSNASEIFKVVMKRFSKKATVSQNLKSCIKT